VKPPFSQRGSVSIFLVILTPAFFALFGLVVDGGDLLAAQQKAVAVADAAARRGSQDIDEDEYRRTGAVTLDVSAAQTSATQYFTSAGYMGEVSVMHDAIEVSVSRVQELPRLSLVGVSSRTVHGVGTARIRRTMEAAP